jgi:hypothetical protein
VERQVERLRERLLDLSNRNRLLNFKHPEKSRKQARVIDELPAVLYERLLSSRSFRFKAVDEPPGQAAATRIAIDDAARQQGLNPSFDLGARPSSELAEQHSDNAIQLLHYPIEMARRLEGMRQEHLTSLQELGVPSLYAVFGFLEWYEKPDSPKPLLSPLVLVPLEIERMRERGVYQYRVSCSAEEPEPNRTLSFRLKQDVGLLLPDQESLVESQNLDEYFVAVEAAITPMPRWRLRRFVTVCAVSFARQVMYEDLAPERWKARGSRGNAPLVSSLLAGVGTAAPGTPHRSATQPLLITEADSTQVAAIQDALAGRSMVVKGPPGTGKSQTITNLIAAALAANKKVLFVAEKMAALDVVKKRLDDAGLANFCLALHSTKAKKRDVLDALEASRQEHQRTDGRISHSEPYAPERAQAVGELESYLKTIASPFGATGSDARQLVWREHVARAELGAIAPGLLRLVIPGVLEMSAQRIQESARRISELEASIAALGEPVGPSPWSFVTHWDPLQHSIEATLHAVQKWVGAVGDLTSPLVELGWPADDLRLEDLGELGAQLADLAYAEASAPAALVALLLDQDLSIAAAELANDLEARRQQARRVEGICPIDKALPHRTRLLELSNALRDANLLPEGMTYAEIPDRLQQRRAASDAQGIAVERLKDLGRAFEIPGSWDKRAQRILLLCGKLAAEAGAAILKCRVNGCLEDDVVPFLDERAQVARSLWAARAEIDQSLNGWDPLGAQELRRHATVLRSTGFFGRLLGATYKASVSTYLSLSTGRAAEREVMASQLQHAAQHLEAEAKWLADPRLSHVCGRAYRGLSTDLDELRRVALWGRQVRTVLPGADALSRWARNLLFSVEAASLTPLIEFYEHSGDALLKEFERSDIDLMVTVMKSIAATERIDVAAGRAASLGIDGRTLVANLAQVADALEAVATLDAEIDASPASSRLGSYWQGSATDVVALKAAINASTTIREIAFPSYVASWLVTAEFATRLSDAISLGRRLLAAVGQEKFVRDEARASGIGLAELLTPGVTVEKLKWRLQTALKAGSERLARHVRYVVAREACRADEAAWAFYGAVDDAGGPWTGLTQVFEWCVLRTLCAELMKRYPKLAQDAWSGGRLTQLGQQVREYEKAAVQHRRIRLVASLASTAIPQGRRTGARRDWTDLALLTHEIGKQKRNVPIRVLMSRAKDSILALTPCLMMSPLSIAQFLEDPELQFDLLIVDEASQLRPEESIGALLRARQVVVVGDEQQLPPTSFFKRGEDEDAEEDEDEDVEAESLLDLAMNAFGAPKVLRWHYRSRHESLIGFSNAQFYRGELVVAPAPRSPGPGIGVSVETIRGRYQASKNEPEASRVVELVFDLMKKYPKRSIGVVAINQQQSDLIRERIDEQVRDDAGGYIDSWKGTLEPFFVKNLENVQGDERDIIVISMTYGPDETGRVFQRFGPIVGAHGHRRLNVLFSRAKHQLVLVTSLRPEDIRAEVGASRGVQAFRAYLEYAAHHSSTSRQAGAASRFTKLVSEIRDLGFDVVPGVGAQSLEIDLGIAHPDDPSSFVAGVEVDAGETGSLLNSADRELTRPLVLGQLGWSIVQTWTSDWLREPAMARGRLRDALAEACRSAKREMPAPRAVVVAKPLDDTSALPASALATPLSLAVEVREGDSVLSHLEVHGVRVRVGRGQQCEVRIPDQFEEVAAQHLELRWERGSFVITTVDPRAGIYIDGARVTQGSLARAHTYTIRLGLGAVAVRLAYGAPIAAPSVTAAPKPQAGGELSSVLGQVVGQLGPDERQFMTTIMENGQIRTKELVAMLGKSPVRVNGMVRQVRKRLHEAGVPAFFEDVRMPDGEIMYRRTGTTGGR